MACEPCCGDRYKACRIYIKDLDEDIDGMISNLVLTATLVAWWTVKKVTKVTTRSRSNTKVDKGIYLKCKITHFGKLNQGIYSE